MKKIILVIYFSMLFILNMKAQISYHIYGSIDRSDVDKIYLVDKGRKIDSVTVKAGTFDIHGNYKSPMVAMMIIMTKTKMGNHKIILDNGEYNVNIDANLNFTIVSTTSINYNLLLNNINSDDRKTNQKSRDSLLTDYKLKVEMGNYNLSAQYLTLYRDLQLRLLNYYKKLVIDHPDCYIVPYLLKGNEILTQENFGATFDQLSSEVRNNEWGQQLKTFLKKKSTPKPDNNQLIYTLLGSKANYFDSKKVDGKIYNIASLKGKWVLLDFWASWCAPCRAELPELEKAYEQFKNKNFVISYVSVDNTTSEWLKALLEDNTPPFIHSNIAEFGNSDGFKYYQVSAIPANFLINPEGRIVAMDFSGDELISTLTRLIK